MTLSARPLLFSGAVGAAACCHSAPLPGSPLPAGPGGGAWRPLGQRPALSAHRQLSSHTSPPRSQAPWSWFL